MLSHEADGTWGLRRQWEGPRGCGRLPDQAGVASPAHTRPYGRVDLVDWRQHRYVPIPPELKAMLLKVKGKPGEYVFHNDKGCPLSQATFKRKWCQLMLAADCADWREVPKGTNRSGDILKQIKPRLTPHFFRHNYVTLLYESGVDPLIAMKIVGKIAPPAALARRNSPTMTEF